jgi:hypothetical protein
MEALPNEEQASDFQEASTIMAIMDSVYDTEGSMRQQKTSTYELLDEHNLLFAQLKPASSNVSGGATIKLRQANGTYTEVYLTREELVALSRMFDDYVMECYHTVKDGDLL